MKKVISVLIVRYRVFLLLLLIVLIFVIGGGVKLSHELPSEREYVLANAIVKTLREGTSNYHSHEVYFDVANSKISINVYGILNRHEQSNMENLVSEIINLELENNNVEVEINFFPKRSYIQKEVSKGVVSSELVHSDSIRSIKLK